MRIGSGFDAHRYGDVSAGYIVIGGVQVPYHRQVLAHSDGDVLLHALCDALLGALALGDIGKHFPDTDGEYKNANSRDLLRATYVKLAAQNYFLINADLTLIAEAPKISRYVDMMRQNISADLCVDLDAISVKATTTEKLGFIGREEGLAAQATVLLAPA
ncbi:MAG: 2-C-methyl-D-erythritol 2,4-cyclodiphosphate synthase [Pseudomonadales bacterium]|nr:2-C-methyl-D-erythritol 2,4-cyclodiphosphate synthase [Pseudomonadales bacterium]